jgi:thiol-disulfide isomerase/thioredoxin
MKQKLLLTATLLLAAFFSYTQEYKNLVFSPSKPKPGDRIKFEYSTSGTAMGDVKDFEAVAYIFDGQLRAQEVKLSQSGDKWNGEITTNDTTKTVFIAFKKDKMIDNNREQGYSVIMYKNNEPVKGAYIAVADVNSGIGSFVMQLKIEPTQNITLYDKEYARNPDLKSKTIPSYAGLLVRNDKTTAKDKIKPFIDELNAVKNKSESDYQTIMFTYQRLGDKETMAKLKEDIVKKFPNGAQVKADKLSEFFNENDLAKKEALLNAFAKAYPVQTDNDKKSLEGMYVSMVSAAADKKDWAVFKKYEAMVPNKESLAGVYNNLAWNLSGESLDAKADDLVMAKELSGKSLEYLRASMDHPANKPTFFTDKEYKKNQQFSCGMYGDTYALILWKSGNQEEAYKAQETAIKDMDNNDAEANARFIVYKEKLKGPAAVKDDIEGYVKEGKSSPKLNEILKKSYTSEGHSDAEFDAYLEGLMKEYRVKLREELMKKMINEAAPRFALKDLSGNTISLDELKGKVVVVDFWATWCGPCKASFPGMQIALNKYKNDPAVKFVFVDTWESKKPEEMQKNADAFIAKNKYGFQVLLDTDDKVIDSYAVDGIPTKFVIDPESRIRFKAVGFDGSADKLVDEISMMVDVLKPGGSNGTQKGF